jgi:hypothetical protein
MVNRPNFLTLTWRTFNNPNFMKTTQNNLRLIIPDALLKRCNPENLPTVLEWIAVFNAAYRDTALNRMFKRGNQRRKHHTLHDRPHAEAVLNTGLSLAQQLNLNLCTTDEAEAQILSLIELAFALFMHDIGCYAGYKEHANAGADFAAKYLIPRGLPDTCVLSIAKLIARHRSHSVLVSGCFSTMHAIMIMADKFVGDQERVQPERARILRQLAEQGMLATYHHNNAAHDMAGMAIRSVGFQVEPNGTENPSHGTIVLKLEIDQRYATADEIITLWVDRYKACVIAAQFLGRKFRMEFNQTRYWFNESAQGWEAIQIVSVPIA